MEKPEDTTVMDQLVSLLEQLEQRVADLEAALSSVVVETAPELKAVENAG